MHNISSSRLCYVVKAMPLTVKEAPLKLNAVTFVHAPPCNQYFYLIECSLANIIIYKQCTCVSRTRIRISTRSFLGVIEPAPRSPAVHSSHCFVGLLPFLLRPRHVARAVNSGIGRNSSPAPTLSPCIPTSQINPCC